MMTASELRKLEELCEKATLGPWGDIRGMFDGDKWMKIKSVAIIRKHIFTEDDAAFIAESRTAVPKLIQRVRELEEALRWYLNHIPVNRPITPDSAAYEREYGIGRVARLALTPTEPKEKET